MVLLVRDLQPGLVVVERLALASHRRPASRRRGLQGRRHR
ncbi:MAG: hypothetical protein AVDCRST_MAG35-174 [uncultured Quadrisphaera sp.]|uniref:Uncharacterized protein n=1 Tax=uncultured Quadrisphaera sp. TaxID=904978 RepID=A0A6J4NJS2_9ACTN|nr:MAG: hypothetical protein AVDCRST_MAG35-174 [uncultured Quadrisphaera sp.]